MRLLQKIFRRLLNIKGEEVATVPFGANGLIFAEVLKQADDLVGGIEQLKQIQSAVGDIIGTIESANQGAEIDDKAFAAAEKALEEALNPLLDPSLGLSDEQAVLALKGLNFALQHTSEDPDTALALGEAKEALKWRADSESVLHGDKDISNSEDTSMSTGTIKITYPGDSPLSGDLVVGENEAIALKEMSEHTLEGLAPGDYHISLKCGEDWNFEADVSVVADEEAALAVDFGEKADKPPWLKGKDEDKDDDKDKKKADKDADADDVVNADADDDADKKVEEDKEEPVVEPVVDPVVEDKPVVKDPIKETFEQKTSNTLEEISTSMQGFVAAMKELSGRIESVEAAQAEQKQVQADKSQQAAEDDYSMIPGTIPTYVNVDKSKKTDATVDMDDFVDPHDLTASTVFKKAQAAFKKGDLG